MASDLQQMISDAFTYLPQGKEKFFHHLWHERKLKFEDPDGKIDNIDIESAKLVCTSLAQMKPLLLVLPDHATRRMPLLFATCLVMDALDSLGKPNNHYVVYFGSSASIKNYLAQTYIGNQKLSDIFKQMCLGLNSKTPGENSGNLPYVIFSYAPSDIEKIIDTYKPKWVFIDCGEGVKTGWVQPLLNILTNKKIIGIACVQNPLSNLVKIFQDHSWNMFSWCLPSNNQISTTKITPLLIKSEIALIHAEKLQSANHILSECTKHINGKLQNDAWRSVGRLINGLEGLPVPLQLFEAESKNYWGIYPISTLRYTAERFVEAVGTNIVGKMLEKALNDVKPLHELILNNRPPTWLALEQLCVDSQHPNLPNILIFQNRAYKHLFSLAMLAENNIADYELQKLNVWMVSLKEFAHWGILIDKYKSVNLKSEDMPIELRDCFPNWYPILIGAPAQYNYPQYVHLLHHPQIVNLIMPHQLHLANWHYQQWINPFNQIFKLDISALQLLLPHLNFSIPNIEEDNTNKRIIVNSATSIMIDDKAEHIQKRLSSLLESSSRIDELAFLMDNFSNHIEDDLNIDENMDTLSDSLIDDNTTIFIEKALIVKFREKFEIAFNLSDKIQVVIETDRRRNLQKRSVRSLRPGDVILFINGQQRQSLYELIISRVHDHPTFSLHISLIQRWQEELINSYKKSNMPLSKILEKMRAKGSHVETETAIRFWLLRQVMCPIDSKDLLRIADILNMPFVKQYYSQIDRAACRLRGIHISLARKLNAWIEQEAFSNNSNSFNDIVDAELGLDFNDFRDALMILTVDTISEAQGLFLITDLGKLSVVK